MEKKPFDINKYSKAKILSPKKYKVWLSQIQEKGDTKEYEQLNDRLKTDIEQSKSDRKKLFKKWWLKELISAAVIIGGAALVNFFTPFSPFSFLAAGAALLTVMNVVVFGVVPGIRYLTNKYKGLTKFKETLDNQKQLNEVESKEMINDLSKQKEVAKNFVNQEVLAQEKTLEPSGEIEIVEKKKVRSLSDIFKQATQNEQGSFFYNQNQMVAQARTNSDEEEKETIVVDKPSGTATTTASNSQAEEVSTVPAQEKEETTPLAIKELIFDNEPKPKYVFKVKTRTMTADGTCPNEEVFVNIATTNIDKFVDELSKKNFIEKGVKASRSQRAKKASAMINTVENAKELIDNKLKNKEITQKQAEKLKKQITSVVLVLEISNLRNPSKKTYESKEYNIEQKEDFFRIVEQVKQNVLEQAKTIQAKTEQSDEQTF